jgi:DNA-binding transcriptional LysR family regulator
LPVASPFHPLVIQDRQLRLEDLKSYRQVVTRDSAQLETGDSGWLEAEQRWTVSHIKSSIDIVCRGLAFAWLPEQEVAEKLASRQLVRLPLPDSFDRYESFYLNYPDIDSLGAAARSFVAEIRLLASATV